MAHALQSLSFPEEFNHLSDWEITSLDDIRNQIICHEKHSATTTPACIHARTWQANFESYLKLKNECIQFNKGHHQDVEKQQS